MRTLFAAFGGATNSSRALLELIDCLPEDKLLLKNSFKTAPAQLRTQLSARPYDLVLLFGQRKMLRDTPRTAQPAATPSPATPQASLVRLETVALNGRIAYHTEVNFPVLAARLAAQGLSPIISQNAGRYLCNHLYFQTLQYLDEQSLRTKALFIHIPKLRQRPDLPKIATALTASIDETILINPGPL